MFCHDGGMQPQHTYQPVFGTDGAMLYKKRAKRKVVVIKLFFTNPQQNIILNF